ncbi:Hypothetical protein GL50581_3506 [Giardia duodenalis ATCC 50581]|nr:Hypothetical protein GL50581_3506 [Giardia intestinalis ATCC 50581]
MAILRIDNLVQEEAELILATIMQTLRPVKELRSYCAVALFSPYASSQGHLLAFSVDLTATIISQDSASAPVVLTIPPLPHYLLGGVKYATAISCMAFTMLRPQDTSPVLVLGFSNGAWSVFSLDGCLLFPYIGDSKSSLSITAEPILEIVTPESYDLSPAVHLTVRQYSRMLHITLEDLTAAIARNTNADDFQACSFRDADLETSQLPVSVHDQNLFAIELVDFTTLGVSQPIGRLKITYKSTVYYYSDAISFIVVDLAQFHPSCNLNLKEPRILGVSEDQSTQRLLACPLRINSILMDESHCLVVGPNPFVVRISSITVDIGAINLPKTFLDTISNIILLPDQTVSFASSVFKVEVRGCTREQAAVYAAQYIGGSLVDQVDYSMGYIRGDFRANDSDMDCADARILTSIDNIVPETCSPISDLALLLDKTKDTTNEATMSALKEVQGVFSSYFRVPFTIWRDRAKIPHIVAVSSAGQVLCMSLRSFEISGSRFLSLPATSSNLSRGYSFTIALTESNGRAEARIWAWRPDLSHFSQTYEWVVALPGLEIISEGICDGQCLFQSRKASYVIKVIRHDTLYSLEWALLGGS